MTQKETRVVRQKTSFLSQSFESQIRQMNDKVFFPMLNFQCFKINQQKFEKLAQIFL